MGLEGTLDTMPVTELFHWMAQRKRTGILTLKRTDVTKILSVEGSEVINAASTDPREYFGQFLINFGLVSEEQLEKAFETQQETRVSIGRILVMTGLVSDEQMQRILELKIRETTLDVFLWDAGLFSFQDGIVPDEPSTVRVSIDLTSLYHEGVNRQKFYHEIRKVIPDNSCSFICHESAIPLGLDPHSADAIMVQLAGQNLSVADITLRFHSLDFPILKNLYELVRRGWLSVAAGRPSSTSRTGRR